MCVMAVHEPQVESFLADLRSAVDAARAFGRVAVDENLLAVARSVDVATLTREGMDLVLAAAGISLDGSGLPQRKAEMNAILDEAPDALVERLLLEVVGRILRPSDG
jgi:hypothetical protein